MIAHVVLFRPATPQPAEARRALVDLLRTVMPKLPGVQRCRVGRRVRHGLPGYEGAMREDFEYVLLLEFTDVQGLRDYLTHPEHDRLGALFAGGSAALAYDYDVVDLAEAGGDG